MNIIQTLSTYFEYSFVRYALLAGVLISLCASLLGVSLVLKRYSMIGDGLSHVAFGAMAVGAVLGVAPMWVTMPVTIAAAVVLLRITSNAKIKGDAAIAMISVGALALGYLLLNVFSVSTNVSGDVCTTLFGSTSILTLSQSDIILCGALAVVVILIFLIFYHKIFAVTFDEGFACATGINAKTYNTIIAVITAVVIVIFAACVHFAEKQLPVVLVLLGVKVNGNAATKVLYLDRHIGIAGNDNLIAVTLTGFVNRVGYDFKNGVLTAVDIVRAEDNRRTLANSVRSLQHFYTFVAVLCNFFSHN